MKKRIVCELAGGLGNQMFCYAAGLAVAKQNSCKMKIDVSRFSHDQFGRMFLLKEFSISAPITNLKRVTLIDKVIRRIKLFPYVKVTEKNKDFRNPEKLSRKKSLFLDYNWHQQNYLIFHDIKDEVIAEFSYNGELSKGYNKLSLELDNYFTISIHMRFGDYVKIGCCIDPHYYELAISELFRRLDENNISKEIAVVVFSENIHEASEIINKLGLGAKVIYVDKARGLSDIEEFLAMKECDAHIISNSTFSWWSAYLSSRDQKLIVAPIIHGWIENAWEESYFPTSWITIDSKLLISNN